MFAKQENVTKGNNERENRLTLKALRNISEMKVDPAVSGLLTDLEYTIRMEFGDSDNVTVGVFDRDGKKVSTLADLVKMTSIKGMLIKSLETRQKGSMKSVAELTLAAKEKKSATAIEPNAMRRIICLNPYITGLNSLIKTLETVTGGKTPTERFSMAFTALANNYGDVLHSMFDGIRKVGPKDNVNDELYRLMREVGVPQWFHKIVILKANDFKPRINLENPYKMFFSAKGTGSATLLTEELLDKTFIGKFIGLVGTIYDGSILLESIVDRIQKEDPDLLTGGFCPIDTNERTVFKSFKWSMGLHLLPSEAKGFFEVKARNQSCPLILYSSTMYSERLTRVNTAMMRASHMESADADSTMNLFCEVFTTGKDIILSSKQTNLFEVAKSIEGFEDIFGAYSTMATKELAEAQLKTIGRLMSTSIFTEKRGSMQIVLAKDGPLELKGADYSQFAKAVCDKTMSKTLKKEIAKTKADAEAGRWIIDNVGDMKDKLTKMSVPEFTAALKRVHFSDYSVRSTAMYTGYSKSKGLATFSKGGEYYLPSSKDELESMKMIETYAERFQIETAEEQTLPHTNTHPIYKDVEKRIKKSKIQQKLTKKLFGNVIKLTKCFKQIQMQEYVVDTVIATYQEFSAGSLDAPAEESLEDFI